MWLQPKTAGHNWTHTLPKQIRSDLTNAAFSAPWDRKQPSSREHPNKATSVTIRETGIFHWVMSRKDGRYSCEDAQLIPGTKECFCTSIYLSLHHLCFSSRPLQMKPAHLTGHVSQRQLEGIDFHPSFSLLFFGFMTESYKLRASIPGRAALAGKPCGWQMHEAINPCASREGWRGTACRTHGKGQQS